VLDGTAVGGAPHVERAVRFQRERQVAVLVDAGHERRAGPRLPDDGLRPQIVIGAAEERHDDPREEHEDQRDRQDRADAADRDEDPRRLLGNAHAAAGLPPTPATGEGG
jgi:hypothetical protein